MKDTEIAIALEFLGELEYIVLQCASTQDIPYIKRAIHTLAGTPSKTIGNVWYYGKKRISIVSLAKESDWYGYRESSLFYIGRDNDSDITMLQIMGIDLRPTDIR